MKGESIVAKVREIKIRLEKDRDALRALQPEIEELLDGKDDDIASLESVIDSLSRFV